MKIMSIFRIIGFIVIFNSICYGMETGIILGVITDSKTGEPISGVTVRLDNTGFGCISDRNGNYIIKSVPSGKYEIFASLLGYNSEKKQIQIEYNNTTVENLVLNEQPLKTAEIVVSANKHIQAVQEVPITISILDSRSMLDRNITKADEALSYIPGIIVAQDNVSIRGSSGFAFGVGSRVALLVDGFPMLSGDQGDMKLDALPLYSSDRIEVVKGAGSALYGTSAIGGVINIITRQPMEKAEFRSRVFSGIYTKPRYSQWEFTDKTQMKSGIDIAYSKKFGSIGVMASGGYYSDDSYRLYDDSRKGNLFGKLSYDFTNYSSLTLFVNYAADNHADWIYWESLDSATRPPIETDLSKRLLSYKASAFGEFKQIIDENNFILFKAGLFNTYFTNDYPINSPENRSSTGNTINAEMQANSRLIDFLFLTYGINYQHNTSQSVIIGDNTQNISAVYFQGELSELWGFNINAGARLDYEKTESTQENLEFSPKLGILYSIKDDIHIRASVGRGFRAPMIAERFPTLKYSGFDVIPNLNLKPEKSWSFEIGTSVETKLFEMPYMFDISAFQSDMDNLIEPQPLESNPSKIQFMNITRARIRGIEIGIKTFLFNCIGIESNLTAMEPNDLDSNRTLKYRSNFIWYSRLTIPYNFLEFQLDYRYISRFENYDRLLNLQVHDGDARVPIHVVDARLIIDMKKLNLINMKVSINAKNLFDYYYVVMIGNLGNTRYIGLQLETDI